MYRYLYILGICLLGFSSCSLPGIQTETADEESSTILYEDSQISLLVPKTWSGVTESSMIKPVIGGFVVGFVSPDVRSGFSNNLIIIKDNLSRIVTSEKYSILNNLQTKKNYFEYIPIKDIAFTFSDSEPSRLYIFEARYNETTPKQQFIQTTRVCGSTVYLLHFSLSMDKNPAIYSKLLESFSCK